MAKTLAPTKGNLMAVKNTLKLSEKGYEMLDKKRNILIREMMQLIDEAKYVQEKIESTFGEAYTALSTANLVMGVENVKEAMHAVPVDESVKIKLRSVMGVELPTVTSQNEAFALPYGLYSTNSALDAAFIKFSDVKKLTLQLAETENSVYRLAVNIRKTQKRANALKNITIPLYKRLEKEISNALEEKEREEHTRLKIIKRDNL